MIHVVETKRQITKLQNMLLESEGKLKHRLIEEINNLKIDLASHLASAKND